MSFWGEDNLWLLPIISKFMNYTGFRAVRIGRNLRREAACFEFDKERPCTSGMLELFSFSGDLSTLFRSANDLQ